MSATPSTSSSASSTTSSAQASPDEVTDAQRALRQQGLYKGPVDGKIGPETRTAISRFQKQNGLKQTAQLDEPTMNNLQGPSSGVGSSTQMPSNSSMPGVSGGGASSPGVGSSGTDKDDDNDTK
jgi:peptidoglycan hydrolase-like protein with peptidoglycan-binding domain